MQDRSIRRKGSGRVRLTQIRPTSLSMRRMSTFKAATERSWLLTLPRVRKPGDISLRPTKHLSPMVPILENRMTCIRTVSYTHLRAHETRHDLVCRLLLEKKKKKK